jgi:putative Holliday junction resolvase
MDQAQPAAHPTPRQGRAVALDVGRARIGIAVTSARGDQALAHAVLPRKGTRADIARLLETLQQSGAQWVVVGLPPQGHDAGEEADGEGGASARLARQFAAALAGAQPLPVVLVDEADTTVEAHDHLRALGLRAARRRREVDKHAAKQILDRWLAGASAERVEPARPQPS